MAITESMTRADASRRGRALQRSIAAAFAAIAGCYAHAPPPPRSSVEDSRPPLIADMRGRYEIRREGRLVGEEAFTIRTSTSGVWRAEGVLSIDWPVERTQGYVLEIE